MYKIRRATLEDIPEIARIIAENFDHAMEEHSLPVREFCKAHCSSEQLQAEFAWREMYVAVNAANRIAGTAALVDFGTAGTPKICLSNFFVRTDLHGRKIGGLLMNHLLRLVRKRHVATLHVPSSRTAVGFYRHYQFTTDRDQPAEDLALEITWMSKNIQPIK